MRKIIIFILCVLLVLSGCGAQKPEKVVSNFLDALKKQDYQKAGTYVQSNEQEVINVSPGEEALINSIMAKLSYKDVKEVYKDQDKAVVTVKITSIDLLQVGAETIPQLIPLVLTAAFSSGQNQKDVDRLAEEYITQAILEPSAPTVTTETSINLQKVSDQWLIIPDDQLFNAMIGDIKRLVDAMSKFSN